jgi:glycosyltransferase involved in cell wall biosynthesis
VPIVSSDCSTGPCEILRINHDFSKVSKISIEDCGILFPTGDDEELFKAMEKIYLDKKLHEKFKKNSSCCIKNFDINCIIKDWESLLLD